MRRLTFVLITLLCAFQVTYSQDRGLMPGDYYKEVAVSQVAVSPNGNLVAFTVTTIVEKKNKRHREIWIQQLENGKPAGKPYRFTGPTHESSSPRWSPDGSLLSFVSRRGEDKNAIWFIRVSAPGGEAFHIDGVEGVPVWSPDGKWIAFTKTPEDEEKEKKPKNKREGWIAPDAITNTLDAKRFDGRVITSMRYKRDGILPLRPHPSIRKKSQLFVVSAEGGKAQQITTLPYDVGSLEWTSDSQTILFTGNPKQDDEYNREYTTNIYSVPRVGGLVVRITDNPGNETSPSISPDGKRLAYRYSKERGAQTDLMMVDIHSSGKFSGSPQNLTASWDLSPGGPFWTEDGKAVRFSAGIGGNRHLLEVSLESGAIKQVTTGDRRVSVGENSISGDVMAYSVTTPLFPSELFLAKSDGSGEVRLTSFNDSWLSEIKLTTPERMIWKVADGTEIEGWLMKPVDFDPSKKYPFVLKIHGGPHGAYGNYWFRTFQILSASGFFVLYPNPRGSSGYGNDFQYATRGKWGEMDQEDYLGGVDAAMAKYSQIDPKRIGVSGGSYGGYMTNWLTATTDRFAAAVTSRSIVLWESWYGTSDAQGLTEYEFFGYPWEQRELYRRLSPLSYVENVTAPTLIIHSEDDHRTPIADGEMWFMALKKRKVPTEFVRYPRSSHGLSRTGEPWLLVDRLERLRTWFVHWLITEHQPKSSGQMADLDSIPEIGNPAYDSEKGPVVTIDAAHHNFHTMDGRFQPFAELLRKDGYRLRSNEKAFTPEILEKTDILVISNSGSEKEAEGDDADSMPAFSHVEVENVRQWVLGGGSLLLIADHQPMPGHVKNLAAAFGIHWNNGFAVEPKSRVGHIRFSRQRGTLREHAITSGRSDTERISFVQTFTGSAFHVPGDFQPLMVFRDGLVSLMPKIHWDFKDDTPSVDISGWYQGGVMKFGKGKVAVFGEAAMFTAQKVVRGENIRRAGFNSDLAPHNAQFVLNVIHWLDGLLDQ